LKIGNLEFLSPVSRLCSMLYFLTKKNILMKLIQLFIRFALAAGFLSASADRFGLWHQNVAWGNWESFVEYTAILVPLSGHFVAVAAVVATACEVIFGIVLLIGWKTKLFGVLSGALLLVFGISMALTLGIKAPFDYSVFSAAAAGFALWAFPEGYLSVDNLKKKQKVYRF